MVEAEKILKAVQAAFEHESRINLHQYPLHMAWSDGNLTLEGEVESIIAKKLALELAAAVPRVDGIIDRLRVAPAQRMGDGALRDHVRDALLQEPALKICTIQVRDGQKLIIERESTQEPGGRIDVLVEDGVVTLDGRVPSLSHKRLAGVLAWWAPGSRDVVNALEIVPPQTDNEDEITDAVRLVLEKNPFVDASQLRVSTNKAIVTLEGEVTNETEKRMAEFDVWYVFGVDKVINKIVSRS